MYLALAEDHLKEQFLGRDRTPATINNIIAGGFRSVMDGRTQRQTHEGQHGQGRRNRFVA